MEGIKNVDLANAKMLWCYQGHATMTTSVWRLKEINFRNWKIFKSLFSCLCLWRDIWNCQELSYCQQRWHMHIFWSLQQLKIGELKQLTSHQSAFLQSRSLQWNVFIYPPPETNTVWLYLEIELKCLYGLNNAAREFFDSVKEALQMLQYQQFRA